MNLAFFEGEIHILQSLDADIIFADILHCDVICHGFPPTYQRRKKETDPLSEGSISFRIKSEPERICVLDRNLGIRMERNDPVFNHRFSVFRELRQLFKLLTLENLFDDISRIETDPIRIADIVRGYRFILEIRLDFQRRRAADHIEFLKLGSRRGDCAEVVFLELV